MKRLIVLLFLPVGILNAQEPVDSAKVKEFTTYDRGNNIISPILSGGYGGDRVNGTIGGRFSRFFKDKLSTGLSLSYQFSGRFYKSGNAGVFGRYNLLKKKISPFVELGYNFGMYRQTNGASGSDEVTWNGNVHAVYAAAGVAFRISKHFSFDISMGYQYSWINTFSAPATIPSSRVSDGPLPGIRFNIHF